MIVSVVLIVLECPPSCGISNFELKWRDRKTRPETKGMHGYLLFITMNRIRKLTAMAPNRKWVCVCWRQARVWDQGLNVMPPSKYITMWRRKINKKPNKRPTEYITWCLDPLIADERISFDIQNYWTVTQNQSVKTQQRHTGSNLLSLDISPGRLVLGHAPKVWSVRCQWGVIVPAGDAMISYSTF